MLPVTFSFLKGGYFCFKERTELIRLLVVYNLQRGRDRFFLKCFLFAFFALENNEANLL